MRAASPLAAQVSRSKKRTSQSCTRQKTRTVALSAETCSAILIASLTVDTLRAGGAFMARPTPQAKANFMGGAANTPPMIGSSRVTQPYESGPRSLEQVTVRRRLSMQRQLPQCLHQRCASSGRPGTMDVYTLAFMATSEATGVFSQPVASQAISTNILTRITATLPESCLGIRRIL